MSETTTQRAEGRSKAARRSAFVGPDGPGTVLTFVLALACGALAANLYYAQPLVALIGEGVGLSAASQSLIVTVTQIGYAVGLVLLVPLGDIFENRRVILVTMAANVASLVGMALAPGLSALFALTLVVGITSCAAQMLVPLAAHLAPETTRGQVVGNVMSGLLGGILLARPIASFLADYVGWRGVFGLSAALVLLLLAGAFFLLPTREPKGERGYVALIASLGKLFVAEPVLRRRGLYHAAMFATFSLFWTGAPILLLGAPYDYTHTEVALFTLTGVFGVFAAPVAGRLADRGHTWLGTAMAMSVVVAALVCALFGQASLAALIAAGVLIDLGVQANLVFGQREIYQLDAAIRNRLNAVYMTTFFLGGAFGSAITSPVLAAFGWKAICAIGIAMPAAALAYFLAVDRKG